VTHIQLHNGKS